MALTAGRGTGRAEAEAGQSAEINALLGDGGARPTSLEGDGASAENPFLAEDEDDDDEDDDLPSLEEAEEAPAKA